MLIDQLSVFVENKPGTLFEVLNDLAQNLIEELQCETVFTIPILGGIPVSEAVVVTWIIMAVVVLLCVIFVRNLSVENPGKAQLLLE